MSKELYREFVENGNAGCFSKLMGLGELKKAQRVLYDYFRDHKKVWSVLDYYGSRGK